LTSPADQFASYVLGLFYFDQDIERYFQRSAGPGGSLGDARADFTVDTTNYAAYGEVVFNLSDQWRLITGGRYTSDELDYDFARVGVLGGTLPAGPAQGDTDETNFSGKLALQWDISDFTMTYLSYTQGYKGPAFSISFATDPDGLEAIDPETSDAIEWGVKSSFLDQRMTLNLAAFYTEFKDWQAQAFVEDNSGTGSGGFELSNAGEVSTRGVELDLMAIPLENLTLYGALAWIKAEIDEFNGAPCSPAQKLAGNPASCLPTVLGGSNTQDLSSGDLPYSPEWRATLSANYLIPLESMPFDLVIRGTGRWQDDVLYSVTQDQGTVQDAYGILDLSLTLQDDYDRYTITGFVKNVGDKFYTSSINGVGNLQLADEGGYNQRYPKFARRTFGLEARYRW
jgi:iron complex outermembrane receptor protein